MSQYQVPKRRVPVELVITPGGPAYKAVVFLSELASNHMGPERVSDLLNGPGRFLPTLDPLNDRVAFFNRELVAIAWIAPEDDLDPGVDQSLLTTREITVTLLGGQELTGKVSYLLPPESSRLVHYLNAAQRFFSMHQGDRIALVNATLVAEVRELEPAPPAQGG